MRELRIGEALYSKQHTSENFYFLLRGQLHMTMLASDEKTTKIIDEGQFFGFRNTPNEMRNDFVTAKSNLTEVIQIDNTKFQSIFFMA